MDIEQSNAYQFFREVIQWPEVDPVSLKFKPEKVQRNRGLNLRQKSYFHSNRTAFSQLSEFIVEAYLDENFTESELYDLMDQNKVLSLGKTFPALTQSSVMGQNFDVCLATIVQIPENEVLWSAYSDYVNLSVSKPDPQVFGGSESCYPHFYFWPVPQDSFDPTFESVYRAAAFATFLSVYFRLPVVRGDGSYYVSYGSRIYGIVRGVITTSWFSPRVGTDAIDAAVNCPRDWGQALTNKSWAGLFLSESYNLTSSAMRSVPRAVAVLYCGCLAAEKVIDDLIQDVFYKLRSEGLIPGISPYVSKEELRKLKSMSQVRLARKVPRDIGKQLKALLQVVTDTRPPEPKFWFTLADRLIEAGVAPSEARRFYTPSSNPTRPPKPRISSIELKLRTLIRTVEEL